MGNINLSKQIIKTTSLFKKDEEFNDERFMRVRVAAMHTGINRNNSRFSKECIEKAKDTFANIPILADVQMFTDENGKQVIDYRGHSMHIEDDAFNENEKRMIYDEKVVGLVPETNNFELIYDEESKEYYVWVDALLYREYGNYACDVLESRGGMTDVSMEIGCADLSYSSTDKCLDVGEMMACGLTLLGADVTPGMAKAHAEVFSMNEDNRQKQLFAIIQELKESLDNYILANANENFEEGRTKTVDETNIVEEVTEILEEVTEETTEEVVEETTEEEVTETIVEDTVEDTPEEVVEEVVDKTTEEFSEEVEEVEETETEEVEETNEDYSLKYSITIGDSVKEFSISLTEKLSTISSLVNEVYADDGTWYCVDVYDDDKYVIMQDMWTGRAFKQSYKVKKDSYSLVGDRVEVYSVWCTEDERKKLDDMRANYSAISEKLAKYEAEPAKMEVINSEAYAKIAETKEFTELRDNHFDLSVEEVSAKADEILLAYAKGGSLNFSAEPEKKPVGMTKLPIQTKNNKKSRYGSLFSK